MKTLSQKIKSVMTDKNLSYRGFGRLVNLAHSTIYQIVVKKKTALKFDVRDKLVKSILTITNDDFTEIKSGNTSNRKPNAIQCLLKQYDSSKLMKIKELRENYK